MASVESVLKVEDLVSTASLGVRVLAGAAGLDRALLWAHSCEMVAPEKWLGPHELLMTVGLCVPRDPTEQAAFVRRLDDAGLAGLMIGDHDTAPPVSEAMLQEAEARRFPVLLAAEHIPYAVVARHVAAATSSSQLLQVLKLSKLYQVAANADDDLITLCRNLASLLSIEFRVTDDVSGLTVIETWDDPDIRSERSLRSFRLRGSQPAQLHLAEYPGEMLDAFILLHLLKVLEFGVDRLLNAADQRARVSENALTTLLNGGESPDVEVLLKGRTAGNGFRVAAIPESEGRRIERSVATLRLPALVGPGQTHFYLLIPRDVVGDVRRIAETAAVHFGVSSVYTDYRDAAAAAREASQVLGAAQFGDRRWVEFEGTTIAVLSRSRREADEIINGVLGPLVASTTAATRLRDTLFCYLRNDRHWQVTADELGIHRQTLSYRLNRIEAETGLSINRSADLAALWIAFQAWDATRGS
ncbi:MAG: PucR family transcriptional regulator [Microbacteriaceae bacterium]|jgi:purine catabolism regulator|nr:PucR family transcriptional regulator [Microbacteriaceae bacterium]